MARKAAVATSTSAAAIIILLRRRLNSLCFLICLAFRALMLSLPLSADRPGACLVTVLRYCFFGTSFLGIALFPVPAEAFTLLVLIR